MKQPLYKNSSLYLPHLNGPHILWTLLIWRLVEIVQQNAMYSCLQCMHMIPSASHYEQHLCVRVREIGHQNKNYDFP